MSSQVLTPQQQQNTLSGKKKTKKQTIKNLLATPYSNYWPVVSVDDSVLINTVLQQNLTIVKQEKIKIPWNVMKKIPREDRKNYRSKLLVKEVDNKRNFVFGINETCRLLENNMASSILLSGDVNPPLMVRHILDMAVLKKVAVLLISDLKSTLKSLTGIGSIAIGFKTVLNEDSNYTRIDEKIKEVSVNYPVPINHVNYDRRNAFTFLDKDEDITDDEIISTDDTEVNKTDLYLYRSSNKERVFKPEPSKLSDSNKTDKSLEFISFTNDDLGIKQNKQIKHKLSYKSLIVKRVKSNINRNKKKIELLKKQK